MAAVTLFAGLLFAALIAACPRAARQAAVVPVRVGHPRVKRC